VRTHRLQAPGEPTLRAVPADAALRAFPADATLHPVPTNPTLRAVPANPTLSLARNPPQHRSPFVANASLRYFHQCTSRLHGRTSQQMQMTARLHPCIPHRTVIPYAHPVSWPAQGGGMHAELTAGEEASGRHEGRRSFRTHWQALSLLWCCSRAQTAPCRSGGRRGDGA